MKLCSTGFNEQQISQNLKPEAFSYFEKNLSGLIIKALLKPILRKILKVEKNQENMVRFYIVYFILSLNIYNFFFLAYLF